MQAGHFIKLYDGTSIYHNSATMDSLEFVSTNQPNQMIPYCYAYISRN